MSLTYHVCFCYKQKPSVSEYELNTQKDATISVNKNTTIEELKNIIVNKLWDTNVKCKSLVEQQRLSRNQNLNLLKLYASSISTEELTDESTVKSCPELFWGGDNTYIYRLYYDLVGDTNDSDSGFSTDSTDYSSDSSPQQNSPPPTPNQSSSTSSTNKKSKTKQNRLLNKTQPVKAS